MTPPGISQADIERRIVLLCDTLEAETDAYRELIVETAAAEADFKLMYHRTVVGIAASGDKSTVAEREARAHLSSEAEYRQARILAARLDASKQTLSTLRAQLDATRTLSANVRVQT